MEPIDAFRHLSEQAHPLVVYFPFEEDRGHFITGTGTCYLERVEDGSRIALGRFSPAKLPMHLRKIPSFSLSFEIEGRMYGLAISEASAEGSSLLAPMPETLPPFSRKLARVNPSLKAPVLLHVKFPQHGTISLPVRNISEAGLGIEYPTTLKLEESFVCGIGLPLGEESMILTNASPIYRIAVSEGVANEGDPAAHHTEASPLSGYHDWAFFGLRIFPHARDHERIRSYIAHREKEIRRAVEQRFSTAV